MDKRIFYTADLIEPDGSDTGVYGDGCEPGRGETLTSGWWSPNWSRYEVAEDRDHAEPDVYNPEWEEISPGEWLAQQLGQRLGAIERDSMSSYRPDGGNAIYAAEADIHPYEGKSVRPAAHPEGFTAEEYAEAVKILDESRCLFRS